MNTTTKTAGDLSRPPASLLTRTRRTGATLLDKITSRIAQWMQGPPGGEFPHMPMLCTVPDGLHMRGNPVAMGEVRTALRWLAGYRHARRKHQRARAHLSYAQRDAIAALVCRLYQPERTEMPMSRNDWVTQCAAYLLQLGVLHGDAEHQSEELAEKQQAEYGPDAALWQSPMASAQQRATELHTEAEAAAEIPPDETQPDTLPNVEIPNTPGDGELNPPTFGNDDGNAKESG